MSKIYKITNNINSKIYIGKTKLNISERFKQHCSDSKKNSEQKRPLYNAMKKYGTEHFQIELIEECADDIADEREKFWINFYNSYYDGYNATLGGDGKSYIDTFELLQLWNSGKTLKEISEITKHDCGWLSFLLKNEGIQSEEIQKRSKKTKKVQMLDKVNNEPLKTFNSVREAARYLIQEQNLSVNNEGGYTSHISQVCSGKRKSCLGYKWQYVLED